MEQSKIQTINPISLENSQPWKIEYLIQILNKEYMLLLPEGLHDLALGSS